MHASFEIFPSMDLLKKKKIVLDIVEIGGDERERVTGIVYMYVL